MQTTLRKTDSKGKSKEKTSKDDTSTKKAQEDKLKKSVYSVSTPRNFIQKSSTADIYVQKKKSTVQVTRTPRKLVGNTNKASNVSPMKDLLKSTPSSVSVSSRTKNGSAMKSDAKISRVASAYKDSPFTNVTVNSPIIKKKLNKDSGKIDSKEARNRSIDTKEVRTKPSNVEPKEVERQRSKTKTLNENEVKYLTVDAVDNNVEMLKLSKKLTAKPKAFYVDLEEQKKDSKNVSEIEVKSKKTQDATTNEDEVSYEDDFESYESDFDSYHETQSENSDNSTSDEQDLNADARDEIDSHVLGDSGRTDENNGDEVSSGEKNVTEDSIKDVKDDEKMLDSGNYELRDARSATKPKPALDFIVEDAEVDVRSSLTDEGFQEMSSSGVSSMKIIHTDVIERPLFIDFTASAKNKRKKKIFDRLKQRAKDILSMVTLHEMSYSLFEMTPIPYDVYMATFGRTNYTQVEVQTFDDGITEDIQTDEIVSEEKWTQHPIEFSNSDVCLKTQNKLRKYSNEDYLNKFTFLINKRSEEDINNKFNSDENYKINPLRMYFEQKHGVGSGEMLPYEIYESKLNDKQFNNKKLGRFLKKTESKICNILSKNVGDSTDLCKKSKCPFSKGYKLVSTKNIANKKFQFLKQTRITGIILSESKSNLIFTIHSECPNLANKNVLCLWDVSVAIRDPIKLLIAVSGINIARFKGDTSGIVVAGLEDGSIHLWDLSEEPTWQPDVANIGKTTELVEVNAEITQMEKDREWNSKNINVGFCDTPFSHCLLQASAYTTSASTMQLAESASDLIAGLVLDTGVAYHDSSRKVLGQVYALQHIGIITIWSIIQDKLKSLNDIGKAYWSKIKLEKNQTISLIEHLCTRSESLENIFQPYFNLNAAKTRMSIRKKEKSLKRQLSRLKSAVKVDSDRPSSAARTKNTVLPGSWESGIICTDLKIMRLNNNDHYLVAKNCGEVICCTKSVGVVKVHRFCVATDLSTVTKLGVSPGTPQNFIAATDSGTLSLCSLVQDRVLLTLDCRNAPAQGNEKYEVDAKGRFLGTTARPQSVAPTATPSAGISVKSIVWYGSNPCNILALLLSGTLVAWDLTHSDIYACNTVDNAATATSVSDNGFALLTMDGEVQIHSFGGAHGSLHLELFHKYIALL